MALYMSATQRRRTAIVAAVIALLVGSAAGFLVGRSSATSIDDRIDEARKAGRTFASALRVIPLEYDDAMAGDDAAQASDIIERSVSGETAALATAPWLTDNDTATLHNALEKLTTAPERKLSSAEFGAEVETAATEVERLFGIAVTESPG